MPAVHSGTYSIMMHVFIKVCITSWDKNNELMGQSLTQKFNVVCPMGSFGEKSNVVAAYNLLGGLNFRHLIFR